MLTIADVLGGSVYISGAKFEQSKREVKRF